MASLRVWLGVVLAFALALPALAAPKFPPLTGRVVDDAQILSTEAEAKLTAQLAALEQKTGRQLVVATLPTLQGYEIEDYGYQLLRTWAIGRKAEDDGAILIVAPNERKVRIEVGYGLEPVLTDALSSLIIQRRILPAFRTGNMEQGVVDGTEAIIAQLGLPPEEAQARASEALTVTRADVQDGSIDLNGIIVSSIFVIMGIIWILRVFGRRRTFASYRRDPAGWAWVLPLIVSGLGDASRGGGWRGGGGGGGFSGGGGSGGGGGASGSW
ncbi:TPM domain-containing protein [Phenylobacterium sp.]|uniref:TPM domain-containing protein n=1 Tax=Phenylobacterium sp. TaxID=1871053 RepID=UPI002EDB9BAF